MIVDQPIRCQSLMRYAVFFIVHVSGKSIPSSPKHIILIARFIAIAVPTCGEFSCLLMILANSLDPDQDGQNVLNRIQTI